MKDEGGRMKKGMLRRRLVAPLADGAGELIECHYPLIHRSNTGPWHWSVPVSTAHRALTELRV